MTTPSIGYINVGMILGKINDITHFISPSKVLAFAELNPSVYKSGNLEAKHTRISKRGSRTLRSTLINVAHNVVKNNQIFKTTIIINFLKVDLITMRLNIALVNWFASFIRCLPMILYLT